MRAQNLRPGMAVWNPLGQEPWVLDVLAVGAGDTEKMVTVTAVQGSVRVAEDWPVHLYTMADADLEHCLLVEEEHRR